MSEGRIAELSRRGAVSVGGADAEKFLNDLITSDVPKTVGGAVYGGLLTPQGKILFDLMVFRDEPQNRFLFDLPKSEVAAFVKRLTFYRLRAKVKIADISDERIAVAAWGGDAAPIVDGTVAPDARLAALGYRAIVPAGAATAPDYSGASMAEYDAHRISFGIPEGGIDFAFGESFPHEADMDQLAGIDFTKGCYVGQEVVSRMEHRGTARRRFVLASSASLFPPIGTAVTAGEKVIGTLGSSAGGNGLALVRLDRAREAMDDGTPITADGARLALTLPPWAKFSWPTSVAEA
jgi:folate-binding protein YgfZ